MQISRDKKYFSGENIRERIKSEIKVSKLERISSLYHNFQIEQEYSSLCNEVVRRRNKILKERDRLTMTAKELMLESPNRDRPDFVDFYFSKFSSKAGCIATSQIDFHSPKPPATPKPSRPPFVSLVGIRSSAPSPIGSNSPPISQQEEEDPARASSSGLIARYSPEQRSITVVYTFLYASLLHKIRRSNFFESQKSKIIVIQKSYRRYLSKKRRVPIFAFSTLFIVQLRINRKRRALLRIKSFMNDFNSQKEYRVIKRFLHHVKLCQRIVRTFLVIKRDRLYCLRLLWDKIEKELRKKLTFQQQAVEPNHKTGSSSVKFQVLSSKGAEEAAVASPGHHFRRAFVRRMSTHELIEEKWRRVHDQVFLTRLLIISTPLCRYI